MKNKVKCKPPKAGLITVDSFGNPWSAIAVLPGDRRVRYVPASRGTATALKVAVKALGGCRNEGYNGRTNFVVGIADKALARIRKLTGGKQ